MCEDNCNLLINTNVQGATNPVLTIQDNDDSILVNLNATQGSTPATSNNATAFGLADFTAQFGTGSVPVTITEQGPNSGVFGTYDESDISVLKITTNAKRGTSASIDYNESPVTVLVGFSFASLDIQPIDDEWSSGEEIPIVIIDGDQNKNSRVDEDLDLDNVDATVIPALKTGDPFTIGEGSNSLRAVMFNATVSKVGISTGTTADAAVGTAGNFTVIAFDPLSTAGGNVTTSVAVDTFSQRGILSQTANSTAIVGYVVIDLATTLEELQSTISQEGSTGVAFNFFNYNVESFGADEVSIYLLNQTNRVTDSGSDFQATTDSAYTANAIVLVANGTSQGYVSLSESSTSDNAFFADTADASTKNLGLVIEFDYSTASTGVTGVDEKEAVVADFFSFGFTDDGVQSGERFANQIIRIEAEESGDNTSTLKVHLSMSCLTKLTYRMLIPLQVSHQSQMILHSL
jgi:hypothetical protein